MMHSFQCVLSEAADVDTELVIWTCLKWYLPGFSTLKLLFFFFFLCIIRKYFCGEILLDYVNILWLLKLSLISFNIRWFLLESGVRMVAEWRLYGSIILIPSVFISWIFNWKEEFSLLPCLFVSGWVRGFTFYSWTLIFNDYSLFWCSDCPRLGQWEPLWTISNVL